MQCGSFPENSSPQHLLEILRGPSIRLSKLGETLAHRSLPLNLLLRRVHAGSAVSVVRSAAGVLTPQPRCSTIKSPEKSRSHNSEDACPEGPCGPTEHLSRYYHQEI